jgi:hypothetical protein
MRSLHLLRSLLLAGVLLVPLSCSTGEPPTDDPPATAPQDITSISSSAGRMSGGDYSVTYQLGHPTTAPSTSGGGASAAPALPITQGAGR